MPAGEQSLDIQSQDREREAGIAEFGQRLLTTSERGYMDLEDDGKEKGLAPLGEYEELEATGKYIKKLPSITEKKLGLGLDTWKRIYQLAKVGFDFSFKSKQALLSSFLILVAFGTNLAQQQLVSLPKMFQSSLSHKDNGLFLTAINLSILYVSILFIGNGSFKMLAGVVRAWIRKTLTLRIHTKYLRNKLYYKAIVLDGKIDNPDERIVRDIQNFCDTLITIFDKFINCALLVIFMTSVNYGTLGIIALVPTAILLTASILSIMFVRRVVPRVFRQQYLEGDFRFAHMKIRDSAESIAFLGAAAEEHEYRFVNGAVSRAVRNSISVVLGYYPVDLINELLKYGGKVLGFITVGIPFFYSDLYQHMSVAEVLTAVFATESLMGNLSSIVNLFEMLGDVAGYAARVGEMWELEDLLEGEGKGEGESEGKGEGEGEDKILIDGVEGQYKPPATIANVEGEGEGGEYIYSVNGLTVATPDGHVLIRNLNLTLKKAHNLLITGPNGSGKSSFLRVLCGLWKPEASNVKCDFSVPPSVYFSPQTPFIGQSIGTSLRDIITFPTILGENNRHLNPHTHTHSSSVSGSGSSGEGVSVSVGEGVDVGVNSIALDDESILKILSDLGMNGLLSRYESLDTLLDWSKVLSPGEVQMLMFARILYHRYPYVALDEPSSAMALPAQSAAYSALYNAGIHYVTIGHGDTLSSFHQVRLTLNPSNVGEWSVEMIES